MARAVHAVFFDMGGTLRYRIQDPEMRAQGLSDLKRALAYEGSPETLFALLKERAGEYKAWSQETLTEAPEEELWTRWMWPEGDAERIRKTAVTLEHYWRATQGRRVARPDAKRVVDTLHRRGYAMGIISNTTSREAVPRALVEYGLEQYFSVVVLSSTCGHRKPGKEIFQIAVQKLGVAPDDCAYVGDRPSRDVLGAKSAGFSLSVLIRDEMVEFHEPLGDSLEPDHTIRGLAPLLNIL
ncbi:MAG: HAD family hydrolase [Candidatus Bipolaricaulota bacterium]|nr:MAG: HAD family hydrolase [Candidatus Bipolaricaulota bacterium]